MTSAIRAATTSRGARSPRGSCPAISGVPSRSRSTAPAPRSASVISGHWPLAPGSHSTVGWNWTNSRSLITAPARAAIAIPSPVAPAGFDVVPNACPSPPAAITTARAEITPGVSRPSAPMKAAVRPVTERAGTGSRVSVPTGSALAAAVPSVAPPVPIPAPSAARSLWSGRASPARRVAPACRSSATVRSRISIPLREQRGQQRPVHLGPGRVVARVHDPAGAVPALQPQVPRLKPRAEPGQPVDRAGRARPRAPPRPPARTARPRPSSVSRDVRRGRIARPEGRREPALRQRRRPAHQVFGHHQHPQPARGRRQRGRDPRRPGPDDHDIRVPPPPPHRPGPNHRSQRPVNRPRSRVRGCRGRGHVSHSPSVITRLPGRETGRPRSWPRPHGGPGRRPPGPRAPRAPWSAGTAPAPRP